MNRDTRSNSPPGRGMAGRLTTIALIFGVALLLELHRGGGYSARELRALSGLVGAALALTLLYTTLRRRGRDEGLCSLELGGDGLLIASLVYCTGGARSLFGFLFVLWIVHAALRAGPRAALVTASLAILGFGAVVLGPQAEWFPVFEGPLPNAVEAIRAVGTHSLAFLGVAVLARQLAREVEEGKDELHGLGELHRRIMENVSSGLLTVDPERRITSFNREAERITGHRGEEVCGTPLERLFPELPVVGDECRGEMRFVNGEGEELHIGYSRSSLRDDRGTPDGAVLIFQDLTHVVEMEEKLRRSERLSAVGQLAAGLAHEIRNPLASLSGAIELLANDLPHADPSSRRLVGIVKRETERLNRLLGQFLAYARPGPRRREPIELGALLEEIASLLASGEHRALRLDLELTADLWTEGDPDQLRQAFWNLVLNAAEAEPIDGRIRVQGGPARELPDDPMAGIEIEIRDRGRGIAPEHLERIFEPFFTTRPKGTGLGLATVHRVVEEHSGRLQISSQPGQETCVRVRLPRIPPPGQATR